MKHISKSTKLYLDWCSFAAAKYACAHWHYSKKVPAGKNVYIGVWEDGTFIGVIIFGGGANRNAHKPFGILRSAFCELTRIALSPHIHPVSRMVAVALKMIKKAFPGIRIVLSMADPEMRHHGGIYQAGNWVYIGKSSVQSDVIVNGKPMHKRSASIKYGTIKGLQKTKGKYKLCYIYILDKEMKPHIEKMRKPYPKNIK